MADRNHLEAERIITRTVGGSDSVTIHVAFLRAINVGGRRISNVELGAAVESLGYDDVAVYQASGNVLLGQGPHNHEGQIANHLSAGLSERLGYEVPAIVRSAAEVHEIASAAPFRDRSPPPDSTPQVMLMADAPDVDDVAALSTGADQLAVVASEIHWWPTVGISTSDLDVRGLEARFGTMTVRTLGAIKRISARIA